MSLRATEPHSVSSALASAGADSIDAQRFRRVLARFASGVTVLTANAPEGIHAMTASAFMSGSLEPPLVVVSVGTRTRLHGLIDAAGAFGVSILRETQENHSRRFGGQVAEPCEPRFAFREGVPVLDGSLASLTAQVEHRYACGDHSLYVGRVLHLELQEGQPLLYYCTGYRRLT